MGRRVTRAVPAQPGFTPTLLRVTHCPVNFAGIGWTNVQALRRRGVDARLVVYNTHPAHPEADENLRLPQRPLWRRRLLQFRALANQLPATDVFHFYFGLTLVPKRVQFPILKATRKKSVFHFVGSDIRGKTPEELAYARRADAQIIGSYDAARWLPEAEVVPPGIDLSRIEAAAPLNGEAPVRVAHAALSRNRKGTDLIVAACQELGVELDVIEGIRHDEVGRRIARADIVVDQLNSGWYGLFAIEAMAHGKPVVGYIHEEAATRTAEAFGVEPPLVRTTKETLATDLRRLVESGEERAERGAASRAYVERVHDADAMADRLLAIYAGL
jgi:glycosyltransferase involved in cell wall biosynthesis